jgi:3-oxoacyl-[acyl-carrier protein] reductase
MSKFSSQKLPGRVALVTGSGSGIGRATSLRLSSEGADIIANDVNKKTAEETGEMIRRLGRRVLVVEADVSKSNEVTAMTKEAYEKFGRIDILVNNAGISGTPYKLIDLPEEEWDHVTGVNLRGTWLVSKAVCKQMVKQDLIKGSELRGKVINIASIAGKNGSPTIGCYAATKAGIISMTQTMSLELAPRITVNAICPGFHLTNIYRMNEDLIKAAIVLYSPRQIPLKRIGLAEDVANVAAFLASSDSDYMTGQAVNVDGGITQH